MRIRAMERADWPGVAALWNASVEAGEVVYKPLTEAYFRKKFLEDANYWPELSLVAEEEGKIIGFLNGVMKRVFLPKQNHQNTPGYITCFLWTPAIAAGAWDARW